MEVFCSEKKEKKKKEYMGWEGLISQSSLDALVVLSLL